MCKSKLQINYKSKYKNENKFFKGKRKNLQNLEYAKLLNAKTIVERKIVSLKYLSIKKHHYGSQNIEDTKREKIQHDCLQVGT
jgi:hypothetical protein